MSQHIATVQRILKALAEDKLFQDDLKNPLVLKAIRHWSGIHRLPREEAENLFMDNYRINNSVLPWFLRLQQACQTAKIGIPLQQIIEARIMSEDEIIAAYSKRSPRAPDRSFVSQHDDTLVESQEEVPAESTDGKWYPAVRTTLLAWAIQGVLFAVLFNVFGSSF